MQKQNIFNIKKADWDKFEQLVESKFDNDVLLKLASLNSEKAVHLFKDTLEDVCNRSIPRKKAGHRTVPWWNNEIANLRLEVSSAKKQMLRARKMNIRNSIQDCEAAYRHTRNRCVSIIKKSKIHVETVCNGRGQ